ncbi:uncharacterized protein LOC128224434 [Mya arenaria]|uniref:uncharacterized protein LOC128224434 n=1 Tax=Mya arenaria TaxID=6604 RepID=UPI0022E1BD80|nr:uncharacterized protein LOC128224434 [Mya arenaria]
MVIMDMSMEESQCMQNTEEGSNDMKLLPNAFEPVKPLEIWPYFKKEECSQDVSNSTPMSENVFVPDPFLHCDVERHNCTDDTCGRISWVGICKEMCRAFLAYSAAYNRNMSWMLYKLLMIMTRLLSMILSIVSAQLLRRRSGEDLIVEIQLIRSGLESNPGPRDWIAEIPPEMPATDDDLAYLSNYIGKGWRHLGRKLGLGPARLDHIEHDFQRGGMRDQIFHMLLKVKAPPLEASLKDILETLDVIEAEFSITVEWSELSLRFRAIRQNQLTEQENNILALQAENEELKTENQELKEKLASLERDSGALKRCSEDGDAATGVKKIKHE